MHVSLSLCMSTPDYLILRCQYVMIIVDVSITHHFDFMAFDHENRLHVVTFYVFYRFVDPFCSNDSKAVKWNYLCFVIVHYIGRNIKLDISDRNAILPSINHCTIGYYQTSNISLTLVDNKIVDHKDVVGASSLDVSPTSSSFSI